MGHTFNVEMKISLSDLCPTFAATGAAPRTPPTSRGSPRRPSSSAFTTRPGTEHEMQESVLYSGYSVTIPFSNTVKIGYCDTTFENENGSKIKITQL